LDNPVVRTDTRLTYVLELDDASVVELEQALSHELELGLPRSPSSRLPIILHALKKLVSRMGDIAPYLAELQVDAVITRPTQRKQLTDDTQKLIEGDVHRAETEE
jgi:hypothetical protein